MILQKRRFIVRAKDMDPVTPFQFLFDFRNKMAGEQDIRSHYGASAMAFIARSAVVNRLERLSRSAAFFSGVPSGAWS